MGELIFLGILAIIGVIMFGMSFGFQTSLLDKSGGPALYPRIVIVVLVIFLVVRCVMIIRSQEELKKKFHFLEILQGSRFIAASGLCGHYQTVGICYKQCNLCSDCSDIFTQKAIWHFYHWQKSGCFVSDYDSFHSCLVLCIY